MASDLTDLLSEDRGPLVPQSIPAEMKEGELAQLLGVTGSRVRTLVQDGLAVRSGRGRYDVPETLRRYLGHLRAIAGRHKTSEANQGIKAATERLKQAQADLAEAKAATARGELVPAAEVTREWAGILRDLRNALLAVPSRCGASLPHLTAADIATIESEIRSALEGLADEN